MWIREPDLRWAQSRDFLAQGAKMASAITYGDYCVFTRNYGATAAMF